jgi:hypothetical protein
VQYENQIDEVYWRTRAEVFFAREEIDGSVVLLGGCRRRRSSAGPFVDAGKC